MQEKNVNKPEKTPEEIKQEKVLFRRRKVWPLVIIVVNFSIAMLILWWSGDWGKKLYSDNYLFQGGRMPVKQEDGTWHAMDNKGEVRSEGYTDMRPYSNRIAAVRNSEGKWGYIDIDGNEIVACDFDYAGDFSQSGLAVVKKENKYFYVNKNGEKQFDREFEKAGDFKTNSVAVVKTEDGYGLLNVNGSYIVEAGEYLEYGDVSQQNGFVAVKNDEGLWGYVTSDGKKVCDCIYFSADEFVRGCAMVTNEAGLYGFVNEKGEEIVTCQYKSARNFSIALFAAVCDENGLWGYVNNAGKVAVECKFKDCLDFTNDESAAVCDENGLWGYIKNNGSFIVECQYKMASKFSGNDMAAVQKQDGKWIYIERSGKQAIEEEFDYADKFTDNEVAIVGKYIEGNLEYAVIDKEGELLVDYGVYENLVAYDSGEMYGLNSDGQYTLLGGEGTVIAENVIGFKPAGDVVVRR